jgi:hypothetical protein
MKSKSMEVIKRLYVEGPLRKLLIVGMAYGPTKRDADQANWQPVDEILIRAAIRHEFEGVRMAAVCWTCQSRNVDVLLLDDEEIELHARIHESVLNAERDRLA